MIKNKKVALILILFILAVIVPSVSALPMSVDEEQDSSSLLSVKEDGFLQEDKQELKVINYEFATKSVPQNKFVEARLVVANYGSEDVSDLTIDHKITYEETGDEISESQYVITPGKTNTIDIGAGDYKVMNYRYKLGVGSNYNYPYNITVFASGDKPSTLPLTDKQIYITEEGSGSGDTLFLDKREVDKSFVPPVSFKHSTSSSDDIANSDPNIPPVNITGDRTVEDVDVAKGNIISFQNIMDASSDDYAEVNSAGSGYMRTGFKYENVNSDDHYGLDVEYKFESEPDLSDLKNFEIKVVDSVGEEIDSNTTYRLNKKYSGLKRQSFQFSKKEINYIDSKESAYVVFNGSINTNIYLYSLNLVTSNDLFKLPNTNLDATVTAEPDTAEVGDRVNIQAEITNTGLSEVKRRFQLFESEDGNILGGESLTDREISINPGQTKTISISTTIRDESHDEFKILDDTASITISDNDVSTIDPNLDVSPTVTKTGEDVDMSLGGVSGELDNIQRLNWDYTNDGTSEVEVTDVSASDITQTKSYGSEGSKTVKVQMVYEREDGSTATLTASRNIEVISNPRPEIKNVVYDFVVDNQEELSEESSAYSTGKTMRGTIASSSCENTCSSTINFISNKPSSDGINMLVLRSNSDDYTYEEVFYGAYNVNDGSGFAKSTSPGSINEDDFISNLESGSNPSAELKDDIEEYKSHSEDYYFILTSGGDPKPYGGSSDLYNGIEKLNANLAQGLDCNLGTSCVFQEDAMWTFVSKTLGDSVKPLHESYRLPVNEDDELQHSIKIVPTVISGTSIGSETSPPVNTQVYHNVKDSELYGTLDEAEEITWTIKGEYKSGINVESDSGTVSYTVDVMIEDKVGSEGSDSMTLNTKTFDPNVQISNETLVSGRLNSIYAEQPVDTDGAIADYQWQIIDSDGNPVASYSGSSIEHEFEELGDYEIRLSVTDTNGDTKQVSKDVTPQAGPPTTKLDVDSVPVQFNTESSKDYIGSVEPLVYYPMDITSGGGTIIDVTKGYTNANYKNDAEIVEDDLGGSSLSVDSTSSPKAVVKHTEELELDESTISVWIKPNDLTGTRPILEKSGSFSLGIVASNIEFTAGGVTNNDASATTLERDEWNHVAVSSKPSNNRLEVYVNGQLVAEDSSFEYDIGNSNSDLLIGSDGSDGFDGKITGVRIYDKKLDDNVVKSIFANRGEYSLDPKVEYPIYNDGTEFRTISEYDVEDSGIVNKGSDRIFMQTDSTDGNNESVYVKTEEIDMAKFDELQLSYTRKVSRELARGHDETNYISMSIKENPEETVGDIGIGRFDSDSNIVGDVLINHQEDKDSGVLELDVSSLSEDRRLYINSKTFGSNKGKSTVAIKKIKGLDYSSSVPTASTLFSSGLYPVTPPHNAKYNPSIAGISINPPKGTSSETELIAKTPSSSSVNLEYDTNTGVSIFNARASTDYTVGESLSSTDNIRTFGSDKKRGSGSVNSGTYNSFGMKISTVNPSELRFNKLRVTTDNTAGNPVVQLDARNSNAVGEGNYIEEYEWDFNYDDSFSADAKGPRVIHRYDEKGEKTIKLRTTDKNGRQQTKQKTINVNNLEPNINAVVDANGKTGDDLRFTHTLSGESDIEKVVWIFGDGNIEYVDPGEDLTYSYTRSGEYDVKAIAIDDGGMTEVDSTTVRVSPNLPDMSNIPSRIDAHVKDTILLDANGDGDSGDPSEVTTKYDASDLEDGYTGGELTYLWKTPDGSEHSGKIATYQENVLTGVDGGRNIRLEVTNTYGEKAVKDITIKTINGGPQIEITSSGGVEPDDGSDATYVGDNTEIYLQTVHSSPRVDVETNFSIGSEDIDPDIDPSDSQTTVTNTYERTFEPDPDTFDPEDFPIDKVLNANITDEYGKSNETGDYTIEVYHRGVEVNALDIYSDIYDEGELEDAPPIGEDEKIGAGAEARHVPDLDAPDAENLEYKYKFDLQDSDYSVDTGFVEGEQVYIHQYLKTGTYDVDVTVRDPTYGFSGSASREIETRVRESCLRIQENNDDPPSGKYYVLPSPDGDTEFDEPVEVRCDMEYDGGGWTLVLSANTQNDNSCSCAYKHGSSEWDTDEQYTEGDGNFGKLVQPGKGDGWKLSTDMINAMMFDGDEITRTTTPDLDEDCSDNRRFFKAATYKHATRLSNRDDANTWTSYDTTSLSSIVRDNSGAAQSSGNNISGIADHHYPSYCDGFVTNHGHSGSWFVESDVGVWLR